MVMSFGLIISFVVALVVVLAAQWSSFADGDGILARQVAW
jgi:hypothetical protein